MASEVAAELSPIPIVGFGGSAGSLEGLQAFFHSLPESTGMAYVVVVHLAPEHESLMEEILQRCTGMPVVQVNEPVKIRANHVYVISPGKELSLVDGWINPTEIPRLKGRHATIDLFFRTLAESARQEATAIVLSGCDGDGALGLKRIKECGGLTIAQEPGEAEHNGMPLAAIATGMVDWILPVSEMAAKITQYRDNGKRIQLSETLAEDPPPPEMKPAEKDEAALRDVLAFLKARCGHDFQSYKRATVLRRIARRMQVNGTETLADYLNHLRVHPGESGALLQDLLISVTNFFRDRDAGMDAGMCHRGGGVFHRDAACRARCQDGAAAANPGVRDGS
jgi:two-component system, chemotaxis family, CheB/CheR fusion protein